MPWLRMLPILVFKPVERRFISMSTALRGLASPTDYPGLTTAVSKVVSKSRGADGACADRQGGFAPSSGELKRKSYRIQATYLARRMRRQIEEAIVGGVVERKAKNGRKAQRNEGETKLPGACQPGTASIIHYVHKWVQFLRVGCSHARVLVLGSRACRLIKRHCG
jgi:hypothetical protein